MDAGNVARKDGVRGQSAIEFLTTYGWALVIIVVVLAALYNVGLFSGNAFTSTSCASQVGFYCGTPTLNSSGFISVQIGETIGQITIFGVGCSNSSTQSPTMVPLQTSQSVSQGSKFNVVFQCTLKSAAIGTPFTGVLWINYSNQYGQMIQTPVAKMSAKVSASSPSSGIFGDFYVPITLTNSQSSSTGSSFQQLITFNPSSYSAYEASDLGNIRFYQGAPGKSQLYSWCESGCTSGSSSAVFWVSLPSGISGSSSTKINMTFLATTVDYDGNFAGEAPELTCSNSNTMICGTGSTYGKYDNGASVFSEYQSFIGSTNGGWGTGSGITVENGIYLTGTGGGVASGSPGSWDCASTGCVLDSYSSMTGTPSGGGDVGLGYDTSYLFNAGTLWAIPSGGGNIEDYVWPFSGTLTASQNTYHVYSTQQLAANIVTFQYDYGTKETLNHPVSTGGQPTLEVWVQSASNTVSTIWIRSRVLPPNDIMPSTSFGSVA
jgi:hypothetical protein